MQTPRRPAAVSGFVALLLVVVIAAGVLWYRDREALNADAEQYQKYQQLMALTTLRGNTGSAVKAPDFTLTDQNHKTISLASLQGKVVVLEFMDPACTDICPVVSQEIRQANELLGRDASQVEFLAVNVNQYHESQRDVMSFSKEQGLNALPNWHFLTGDTAKLKAVWKAYGIQVIPNPTGDVQHSSFMYFIGKDGNEMYIANPDNSKASIGQWAHGISYVVGKLV